MNSEQLTELTHQLYELDLKAIKYVCEIDGNKSVSEIDELVKILDDFFKLKLEIKTILIEFNYIEIKDELARKVLQKINTNQQFEADKYLTIVTGDKDYETNNFQLDELISDSEISDLASDLFYSWFCGEQYVRNLYSIGSMILGVTIPDILRSICDETRKCLALEQYKAVYSLCRTMLETCMRDVGIKKGTIKLRGDDHHFYNEYPPKRLFDCVSQPKGELNKKIKRLYYEISSFIHGIKTVDYKTAENTYFETLKIISKLYESIEE